MGNYLINEKSPYLLQHAENPVDWYSWSTEAFQKAKEEDKPVFLSIGYSTCHWCHVMAHESFEDSKIAEILNTYFVSVKVDREERPDIDMVYMSVCQAITGSGGWPLTIIMTPDKKPFFAGTYLPKNSQYGMMGLSEILKGTAELWAKDRNKLLQAGENILLLLKTESITGNAEPSDKIIKQGFSVFQKSFDKNFGGFGGAPKFPSPHNLLFLLMYYVKNKDKHSLDMVEKTLTAMARGGIHDQIGGGFSRYSTDKKWLVPHFEKMLYDNALLVTAYLEAYRLTHKSYYKSVVQKTLKYVTRELTDKEGGFYCGQDADSEGIEGRYYIFSKKEILDMLGEDGKEFCSWFGITEEGNYEEKNIPNLIQNQRYDEADERIEKLCSIVYRYRLERTTLHKDDKILTAWNAMMIISYAKAAFLLDNVEYLGKAEKAQEFIERKLINKNDRLMVRYRDGESAYLGNLDDYGYYCYALITLYEVTLQIKYLKKAVYRTMQMVELFWDEKNNGFFFYGKDGEELIERPKEIYDGAIPSGNSVAAHVLLKLSQLTGEQKWKEIMDRHMNFLAAGVENYPTGHSFSLMAFIKVLSTSEELICISAENKVPEELFSYLKEQDMNRLSVIFKCPANAEQLSKIAPFTTQYNIPDCGSRYYLCKNHTCSRPFSEIKQLKEYLKDWSDENEISLE